MTILRTFSVLFVLVGIPLLAFIVIEVLRGPGEFIKPYLLGAYLTSSSVASGLLLLAMFKFSGTRNLRVGGTILLTLSAMLFCFVLIGLGQVAAESIAAWQWERSGLPLGDHGSYREFYPGASGMAHWPTPWYNIPAVGLITSVVWGPIIALLLFVIHWLECRFLGGIYRFEP